MKLHFAVVVMFLPHLKANRTTRGSSEVFVTPDCRIYGRNMDTYEDDAWKDPLGTNHDSSGPCKNVWAIYIDETYLVIRVYPAKPRRLFYAFALLNSDAALTFQQVDHSNVLSKGCSYEQSTFYVFASLMSLYTVAVCGDTDILLVRTDVDLEHRTLHTVARKPLTMPRGQITQLFAFSLFAMDHEPLLWIQSSSRTNGMYTVPLNNTGVKGVPLTPAKFQLMWVEEFAADQVNLAVVLSGDKEYARFRYHFTLNKLIPNKENPCKVHPTIEQAGYYVCLTEMPTMRKKLLNYTWISDKYVVMPDPFVGDHAVELDKPNDVCTKKQTSKGATRTTNPTTTVVSPSDRSTRISYVLVVLQTIMLIGMGITLILDLRRQSAAAQALIGVQRDPLNTPEARIMRKNPKTLKSTESRRDSEKSAAALSISFK